MAIFNQSELASVDANDFERNLGIIGLKKAILDLGETVENSRVAEDERVQSLVEKAQDNGGFAVPDHMNVTIEQESIYGLVFMMRNSLFSVAVMNAMSDIVSPLADRIDIFHLEDRIESMRQHRASQLQLQRVIDAIAASADSTNDAFITALLRQTRNFMSNPLLHTIQLFVNKVAGPIIKLAGNLLFGGTKKKSDADRIVQSVDELKEFLMTGSVDRTQTMFQRLLNSGVIGLPAKLLAEQTASLVGISREAAQRREQNLQQGSTLKEQGILKNPKGFISDLLFGDSIVRGGRKGGIIDPSGGKDEDQMCDILLDIIVEVKDLNVETAKQGLQLQNLETLLKSGKTSGELEDLAGQLISVTNAQWKDQKGDDGKVIDLVKNQQGIFETINETLAEVRDFSLEQSKTSKKQFGLQKKEARAAMMGRLLGLISGFIGNTIGAFGLLSRGKIIGSLLGGAAVQAIITKLGGGFLVKTIVKIIGGFLLGPAGVVAGIALTLKDLFDAFAPDFIKEPVDNAFNFLWDTVIQGFNNNLNMLQDFAELTTNTFQSLFMVVVDTWNSVMEDITEFVDNPLGALEAGFNEASEDAAQVVEVVQSNASDAVDALLNKVSGVFSSDPGPEVTLTAPQPQDPVGVALRQIVSDPTRELGDSRQHELTGKVVDLLQQIKDKDGGMTGSSTRTTNPAAVFSGSPIDAGNDVFGN